MGLMRAGRICTLISLVLAMAVTNPHQARGQSATNGVYGGYLGSSAWFSSMRRSAENQAMLRSINRSGDSRQIVPPDYIEFAGVIAFPQGNPFPDKRLPDLVIVCENKASDAVERQPYLTPEGAFYTVFKKGEVYDLYWKYYFGSRERFASVRIDSNGPRERRQVFRYWPPGAPHTGPANQSSENTEPATGAGPASPPHVAAPTREPLTKEEILDLLKNSVPAARVSSLVREFRVAFDLNPAIEAQLRQTGATDGVIAAIRESFRETTAIPAHNQPVLAGPPGAENMPSATEVAPAPPPHYDRFDLSAFPRQPTNFEEQQVIADIQGASSPVLKAGAHRRLARYYEKRGDQRRADAEFAKAKYWDGSAN